MQGEHYVDSVYDHVHGCIALRANEAAVVRTQEFQRLGAVKQLGFALYTWPKATHTRFGHALGVLWLTRRALHALRSSSEGPVELGPADSETLLAAALLHDIGHYPYSHGIEELAPLVPSHEAIARAIIEDGVVADILRRQWNVEPRRVANLVDPREPVTPLDAVLTELIDGPMDMDKMDYLVRDAAACDTPYGRVDVDKIMNAMTIVEVDGAPRIALTEEGIAPLRALVNARQSMFDNVYWHPSHQIRMTMLKRAVQEALLTNQICPAEIAKHDDDSLLALLSQGRMPHPTQVLASLLRLHQVYTPTITVSRWAGPVYEVLNRIGREPMARRRLERRLAAALEDATGEAVLAHDVLVDVPRSQEWKIDVWIRFTRPPLGLDPLMRWRDIFECTEHEFKRYEESRRVISILAPDRLHKLVVSCWEGVVYPIVMNFESGESDGIGSAADQASAFST